MRYENYKFYQTYYYFTKKLTHKNSLQKHTEHISILRSKNPIM